MAKPQPSFLEIPLSNQLDHYSRIQFYSTSQSSSLIIMKSDSMPKYTLNVFLDQLPTESLLPQKHHEPYFYSLSFLLTFCLSKLSSYNVKEFFWPEVSNCFALILKNSFKCLRTLLRIITIVSFLGTNFLY